MRDRQVNGWPAPLPIRTRELVGGRSSVAGRDPGEAVVERIGQYCALRAVAEEMPELRKLDHPFRRCDEIEELACDANGCDMIARALDKYDRRDAHLGRKRAHGEARLPCIASREPRDRVEPAPGEFVLFR